MNLKAIKAAALAAPQGKWMYDTIGQTVWSEPISGGVDSNYMVADIRGWGYLQYMENGEALQDATGTHIATVNPATVMEMVAEIERLKVQRDELLDALKGMVALEESSLRSTDDDDICQEFRTARAAIAKVEESK